MSEYKAALAAVDQDLGAEFVRLACQYDAYMVTTVAMRYITQAIKAARLKCRPTEDAWVNDLAKSFNDAMTRKL